VRLSLNLRLKLKNRRLYLLLLTLFILICIDILSGHVSIGLAQFKSFLLNFDNSNISHIILLDYRIPKTFTALLAGSGLALCGLLMQTLFRNPMAGPFVLGISSGASFTVALVIIASGFFPASIQYLIINMGTAFAGILGAFMILFMMLWASKRLHGYYTILILGLILGQILGAMQGGLNFIAKPESLKQFVLWGLGSFHQTDLWQCMFMGIAISIAAFFAQKSANKLNLYLLGDMYAQSSGINIQQFRTMIILFTGLVAGIITGYCGPIAFIGLAVPHLCRNLFKTHNHYRLIPSVLIIGAILAIICDILSHSLYSQLIPVNIISGLIGGPVVIWVILKQRRRYEF
jgi:iron complex transport system permease protein